MKKFVLTLFVLFVGFVLLAQNKTSIKANKAPLYVLDGKIVDSTILKTLNPNTIHHVNVLKGINATKKFGAKGVNGVVEIASKKSVSPKESSATLNTQIFVGIENRIIPISDTANYELLPLQLNSGGGSITSDDKGYIVKVNPSGLLIATILKKGTKKILYTLNFNPTTAPDGFTGSLVYKLDDFIKDLKTN